MFLFLVNAFIVLRWRIMRVFVKSFGCSTNLADGEVLAGCLAEAGYELADSVSTADVVIYNTCAVKGPTENRAVDALKRVPASKKLIVAGCLPMINFERLSSEVRFEGAVGPAAADHIVDIVKRVLNGEKVVALEESGIAKPNLNLPRLRSNPVVSIVPVNYGCLGSCAYCCVVFARGRLRSSTIQEVVDRVKKDLGAGVREFWITSQDVACYGREQGTNLAALLNALSDVKGDFRVRVGMMTPNLSMDMLEELVQAFRDERVFKFVHLPVQSGDDETLKRMRRNYCVDDFLGVVKAFRTCFPKITLATDIICGFPGESEEAFNRSVRLIESVKPDIVNVSKFFARPRTAAAEMKEFSVPFPEIKRRSKVMAELARRVCYEKNQCWVGWQGEILVDEAGKRAGSWVGRNFAYKPVAVESTRSLFGESLRVNIVEAFSTYLRGEIIE